MDILKITDESCIGAARRLATLRAISIGFNEQDTGKVATIVNELASNLVKYTAMTGQLLFQTIEQKKAKGLVIISVDKGHGMANLVQCLRDGYSTQGIAGTGLGAITRLSTVFDVYSITGQGTVISVQIWPSDYPFQADKFEIGAVCLPKPGETICGDNWFSFYNNRRAFFCVADGLGHGKEAGEASQLACQIASENKQLPLLDTLAAIDNGLRKTRGAAVALAEIDFVERCVRFTGLGNISGVLVSTTQARHLLSRDGTAGLNQLATLQEYTYPWQEEDLLVLHSDGLMSRWNLNAYKAAITRHPFVIAGLLYRDANRGNDDITVLVAKVKN